MLARAVTDQALARLRGVGRTQRRGRRRRGRGRRGGGARRGRGRGGGRRRRAGGRRGRSGGGRALVVGERGEPARLVDGADAAVAVEVGRAEEAGVAALGAERPTQQGLIGRVHVVVEVDVAAQLGVGDVLDAAAVAREV